MTLSQARKRIVEQHYLSSLWLTRFRGGLILDLIAVEPEYQGQGHGALAMKALIRYADAHGLTLALTASPDYGSDKARLEAWYASLGFQHSPGPKGTSMVRVAKH